MGRFIDNFLYSGEKEVLKKRLKNHYKEINLRSPKVTKQCKFDYVCVIDFEATCTATQQNDYPHEIIEFPLVLVNIKTLTIVGFIDFMNYFKNDIYKGCLF